MKKVILLCGFGLLGTFAMASNELVSEINSTQTIIEMDNGYKITITEDFALMCCTATVWYNGGYHTHFTVCGTPWNCALAEAQAQNYIAAQ